MWGLNLLYHVHEENARHFIIRNYCNTINYVSYSNLSHQGLKRPTKKIA